MVWCRTSDKQLSESMSAQFTDIYIYITRPRWINPKIHLRHHKSSRAPSQYPKRRLSVRSRQVSKPRDLYLELSDRSEIWQALRQQCCRCACQISKRYDNLKYQSRGFAKVSRMIPVPSPDSISRFYLISDCFVFLGRNTWWVSKRSVNKEKSDMLFGINITPPLSGID